MDPRPLAIAGFVVLALALVGCGGGDDSGAKTTTTTATVPSSLRFIQRADAVCQSTNREINKLGVVRSTEDIVVYTQKALPQIDAMLRRLAALQPPAEVRDSTKALIHSLRLQREIIRELGVAAKKGDDAEVKKVTRAGTVLAQATAQQSQAAGFDVCGIPQGR